MVPGRAKNGTEQRSIRVPIGLWEELQVISEEMNSTRDPVLGGAVNPSMLLNAAMRDWLSNRGRGDCYAPTAA